MKKIAICADNVMLLPFKKNHVPNTVRWVNNPQIMYLIDRSPEPVTIAGCYRWFRGVSKDRAKAVFAIIESTGMAHIGNCGLFDINHRSKKAKLWMYVGEKRFWERGFGREALSKLLRYGFERLHLNRIYLYVVEGNERARKLYESMGFVKEGVFRDSTFLKGGYRDTFHYGILKSEYRKRFKHGRKK